MRKCAVLFHGDCDGAIAAGLYIRRFLRDMYPEQIILRHSHPWRLNIDLRKVLSEPSIEMVVLVDLALSEENIRLLLSYAKKGTSIIIVDHHQSSEKALNQLKELDNIKILWAVVQSTPQVLAQSILRNLNNYENLLVNVANICEGGNVEDENVRIVADKVKLVLAVGPTNIELIHKTVDYIVKGEEFWNTPIFNDMFWKAKWLLNLLLKKIFAKAKTICEWDIVSFTSPESLIFAGLFGIVSSEHMKKVKRSIVLIREEEDKIVVTIRSMKKKALDLCQMIMKNIDSKAKSTFGGHKEAASLTIKKVYSLEEVENIVENVIKNTICAEK
ncbi:MAG: hypothetical protein QXL96_02625 [Ignisphaera sp.]